MQNEKAPTSHYKSLFFDADPFLQMDNGANHTNPIVALG